MISPSVSADVTDLEGRDKAGGPIVMKIGKYQYQVTPADLAKNSRYLWLEKGLVAISHPGHTFIQSI